MLQGHIELFARQENVLHVAGWLRAPEADLAHGSARLILCWGEKRLEILLRHLVLRRDLPAEGNLPAGYGFHLLVEAPALEGLPTPSLVLARNSVTATPSPLQETAFAPRGGLDVPDEQGVAGWVFQPPGKAAELRVDGYALPIVPDLHRPDLPFDDGSGTPRLGFRLSLDQLAKRLLEAGADLRLFDGAPHEFVLLALGTELARRVVHLGSDVPAAPAPRKPRSSGHIEVFSREGNRFHVAGWIRTPHDPAGKEQPCLLIAWGGATREIPLRRLRDRQDLPAQGDRPAGRGFAVVVDGPDTASDATASLLVGQEAVPLTPAQLAPSPFRPRGGLDISGRDGVQGWVMDLSGERPILRLEGCDPVPVTLTLRRPDLLFDDGTDELRSGFHLSLDPLAAALRRAQPGASLFDGHPRELVLLASGREIARRSLAVRFDMLGMLERAGDGEAKGWLAERGRPLEQQGVDLVLDGTRWASVEAALPRPDLAVHNIALRGGGFRVALPSLHPGEGGQLPVVAVPRYGIDPIPGATVLEGLPVWRKHRGDIVHRLPADGQLRVAVVVPIHNAAAALRRCVESVLRYTTRPARLILMDDASTEAEMPALLRSWQGIPGVEIHRNTENLGFTRTANRGIALAGRDDVVLLNSDTEVGPGWLDGLRAAAHSGPRTGTATAVSDNAGVASVPEFEAANVMPPWFGVEEMARLVRGASLSLLPAVPTGHGFCLYLRRALLDEVGVLDVEAFPRGYGEENDLCMRALRAGYENVLDDRSFVLHQRSASFGAEKAVLIASARTVLDERYPEYRPLTHIFASDPTLLALRWRVRRALNRAVTSGSTPHPRVLFVISTESGGTPQTNRDLMEALSDRYEPWLLRCDTRSVTLSRHGISGAELVETHRLERPIEPATHRSAEYDEIVGDLLVRHGFELVHIRHLAWHGLGLTALCRRLNQPVIFSFHDFYTACPVTKLLDSEGHFCGGSCTAGEVECAPELWDAAAMPPLRHRFVHRWRAMMGAALEECDAFVTTSPSAKATLLANFPFLAGRDFRLIPHGRSFPRMEMLAAEPTLDEPLRVLVPGNVSALKGGGLVAAIAALDRGREVVFHVLGAVDSSLAAAPGLVFHGRYDREDFASHVARIRPHLGAVLSLWPETYCHTLTECWAAGVPVLAIGLGALAERLAENPGGWVVDRWTDPETLLALLRHLRRAPGEVRARRDAVLDWQATTGRHRDATAMAAEYDRLYREVFARRIAFRPDTAPPRVVLTLDRPGGALPSPLAVATRNAVSRPFIFRPVTPSFPFGHTEAGAADAVLVAEGALAPGDLEALRRRCDAAGLLVIEGGADAAPTLGHGLEPAAWLSRGPPPALPPTEPDAPPRVLYLAGPDDPWLPALRPIFEDLTALGVATLHVLGAPAPGVAWFHALEAEEDGAVAILRRVAPAYRIGLAPLGQMALALEALELPVLSLDPALLSTEEAQAEAAQNALLRAVAELIVDAPRRAAEAAEAARRSRAALLARPPGRDLDTLLCARLGLTPAVAAYPPAMAEA